MNEYMKMPWSVMMRLGHAGWLPFVGCALLSLLLADPAERHLAQRLLLGYGAIILSFLGGVHWGLAMRAPNGRVMGMLTIAVLPSLLGWATLLLPGEQALAIQTAVFGGFWFYEHRVLGPGVLPRQYLDLRRWLTLVVVASLGCALIGPALVQP